MGVMEISADDLRLVRAHLDATQAELASYLGVSLRTIVNWEANGVPESKVARTMKVLGRELKFAKEAERAADALQSQISSGALEDASRYDDDEYDEGPPLKVGMSSYERRVYLLRPFSDSDLLDELRERASRRGDKRSNWTASRMERYQKYVIPEWEESGDAGGILDFPRGDSRAAMRGRKDNLPDTTTGEESQVSPYDDF